MIAFAESVLTAQIGCIMQDSLSLLPSVHFPLSSHSHGLQQSSQAEKEVKAGKSLEEVCALLLRGPGGQGGAVLHSITVLPAALPTGI